MNNRRSFLKMLGLGAVAAPAVATIVVKAEAAPKSAMEVMMKYRAAVGPWEQMIAAQREIDRRHSAMLRAMLEFSPPPQALIKRVAS
jgi:hypothetical protein